jgi:hypothetical protein
VANLRRRLHFSNFDCDFLESVLNGSQFNMKNSKSFLIVSTVLGISFCATTLLSAPVPEPTVEPKVINPGPPPSDAIVLFDGKDLSQWVGKDGGPARWTIKRETPKVTRATKGAEALRGEKITPQSNNGIAIVNGTGTITTKESFGDCQLHVEWATPSVVKGDGQGRGNSGIYLQSRYEIQVLDSYNNKTYFHGQAGSVYKQHAPLVNASRKPGEWQYYDIIFHAPRFDGKTLAKAGRVTVLHNGVLVQDNAEILGSTSPAGEPKYEAHPLKQPLQLQDHNNPVRYRNIWIRPL